MKKMRRCLKVRKKKRVVEKAELVIAPSPTMRVTTDHCCEILVQLVCKNMQIIQDSSTTLKVWSNPPCMTVGFVRLCSVSSIRQSH